MCLGYGLTLRRDASSQTIQTRTFVDEHDLKLSGILDEYCELVAPALYNKCPECLDGNLSDSDYNNIKDISDNKDNPNWREGVQADYRLEAITDWIFSVQGKQDISNTIKKYFDKNGYIHFEEEDDEDEWDDW